MITHDMETTDVFRALADPTRREILAILSEGGQSVNAIASCFPVSRPAISKHLRLLREANLVVEVVEGRQRIYHIDPDPLKEVDMWLDEYRKMWKSKLKNLKRYLEKKGAKQK
jgi:DNA-binding transcriptional ArsR family regulator